MPKARYQPPFTLTSEIVTQVADIAEQLGRLSATPAFKRDLRLRHHNRILQIHGTFALAGNRLSVADIAALFAQREAEQAALAGRKPVARMSEQMSAELSAEITARKQATQPAQQLLILLRKQPNLTLAEAAQRIGRSTRTVERLASQLQAAGRLRHIGPNKGGHWEVMEP